MAMPSSHSSRTETTGCRASGSVTKMQRNNAVASSNDSKRKTCMCSPTTHPGSFRCAYHKRLGDDHHHNQRQQQTSSCYSSSGSKLNLGRSAMKNSVVRVGGVKEGNKVVRRALTAVIGPSLQQRRRLRRESFQPRPSRLSLMCKAEDL